METENSNKSKHLYWVCNEKKAEGREKKPVPQARDIRFSTPQPPAKDTKEDTSTKSSTNQTNHTTNNENEQSNLNENKGNIKK